MVPDEDSVPARRLGRFRDAHADTWIGVRADVREADTELHRATLRKTWVGLGVVWCWAGDPGDADEAFAPVRALEPELYGIQLMPIAALNAAFDPIYPPGDQWYWRSDLVEEIPDEAVATNVEFAQTLPNWKCTDPDNVFDVNQNIKTA